MAQASEVQFTSDIRTPNQHRVIHWEAYASAAAAPFTIAAAREGEEN